MELSNLLRSTLPLLGVGAKHYKMVKLQYLEVNLALISLSQWVPSPSEIWLVFVCITEECVGFP